MKKKNIYICPEEKTLIHTEDKEQANANGYIVKFKEYECSDCNECSKKMNIVQIQKKSKNELLAVATNLKSIKSVSKKYRN